MPSDDFYSWTAPSFGLMAKWDAANCAQISRLLYAVIARASGQSSKHRRVSGAWPFTRAMTLPEWRSVRKSCIAVSTRWYNRVLRDMSLIVDSLFSIVFNNKMPSPDFPHPQIAKSHTSFAMSRSLNFWILPVDVFGSSANTTKRGHL